MSTTKRRLRIASLSPLDFQITETYGTFMDLMNDNPKMKSVLPITEGLRQHINNFMNNPTSRTLPKTQSTQTQETPKPQLVTRTQQTRLTYTKLKHGSDPEPEPKPKPKPSSNTFMAELMGKKSVPNTKSDPKPNTIMVPKLKKTAPSNSFMAELQTAQANRSLRKVSPRNRDSKPKCSLVDAFHKAINDRRNQLHDSDDENIDDTSWL